MKFSILLCVLMFCIFHAECKQFIKEIVWKEPSQKVGLTASEKKYLLDLHNLYRQKVAQGKFDGKPQAANMEMMTWCDECARDAQEWANNCGGPAHGNHKGQGQNMAAAMPARILFKSAFLGWCDKESELWDWGSNGLGYFNAGAGHFSQVVWATSDRVGCGFNSCPGQMARLICNFKEQGNMNVFKSTMYIKGKPCSKCPSSKPKCINNALCAPNGAKSPKYRVLPSASSGDRDEVIKFMKRENFLKRCESENKSVDECISDVKKYCGMQRIGGSEITNELIACIRREKCSLPIIPDEKDQAGYSAKQIKFDKTHLKYYLMNTASSKVFKPEELWKVVEMSVAVWACYSKLTFSRARSLKEADLFIEFSPKKHGYVNYFTKKKNPFDSYPFDGPGGVLAHAFFPQGSTHTGNFHYDNGETWIENKGTGIKLLHVTVHELGHNLGLAHIKTLGNIMYPAYDPTFHETEFDLGSLDKYQIRSRYGSKQCVDKVWQKYYDEKYPDPHRSCKDKDRNCGIYSYPDCLQKKTWMKENCANHCGFCGSCEDISGACRNYGSCNIRDPWFLKNCKKHCKYCAGKAILNREYTLFSGANANKQAICDAKKLDGIFVAGRGKTIFIIADGTIYRSPNLKVGVDPKFKLSFAAYSTTGLRHPTASTYSQATKRLFVFEGSKMFIVRNFGKPRRAKVQVLSLPKDLHSPTGAFMPDQTKSDVISLVKGRTFITVQLQGEEVKTLNIKNFDDVFDAGKYKKRIPRKVDGVYQDGEKVSFFEGSSLLVAFKEKDGRLGLPAGPIPFMTTMLKCPQTQ